MVEIERSRRATKSIPLISLIDVVFQMLIYFMLTTSFTRSESLELALPAATAAAQPGAAKPKTPEKTLHIYISDTGETFIERDTVGELEMAERLNSVFQKTPDRGVLVLSAGRVSVGALVKVLDRIYSAGGRNIAVADWVIPKTAPAALKEGGNHG